MASTNRANEESSNELPINGEVRKYGFSSIAIIKGDIQLTPDSTTFRGSNKRSKIVSRFIKGEISKTVALLCRKLRSRGLDSDMVEHFEPHLTDLLADYNDSIYTEQKQEADREQREKEAILDEINQVRNNGDGAVTDMTLEKWQVGLLERRSKLLERVTTLMPEIWEGLEFVLDILRTLNIEDCKLPLIGVFSRTCWNR